MTDKRLLQVAAMVRRGVTLADIGTDHAYLPVYLMQQGRISHAIAADIGEGPAAAASRSICAARLEQDIEVRVGDGLSVLSPEEAQDIVVAGMGGETIASILEAAPWLKNTAWDHRLILQPMTKATELRRWLLQNGFVLEEEHLIEDGRHLYVVLRARFDGTTTQADAWDCCVGALSQKEGAPYFFKESAHLRRRALGLLTLNGEDAAASELFALSKRLFEYAKEGQSE